ncbi:MAG TPA: RluA family pseudouridine synthase [Polyangiaceae bacterium]|nr:RluA family pseudouridine synthase [Polyangiaceae bacterium]
MADPADETESARGSLSPPRGAALRYEVGTSEAGQRVDKVLAERLPEVTRAAVQRHVEEGRVTVNGQSCRAKDRMRVGWLIEIRLGPPPATSAQPDPTVVLDVIYEDEELLVVNKPAGLVVHPARGHGTGTLVNGLLARPGFSREALTSDEPEPAQLRPGIVHRIDKDTSGLLVVAKTAFSREHLKRQLAAHSVERAYLALTVGVPKAGSITTLYGRDPRSRLRFSSQVKAGKRAVTHVKLLERFARDTAALIECRLETGRTHQIRVHLSLEARTPLLGDELYGGLRGPGDVVEIARSLGRQALHAQTLGFVHPRSNEQLRFSSPIPADLNLAMRALGNLA